MQKYNLEKAFDLIKSCGAIIKNADRSTINIEEKEGPANFVTSYDVLVQNLLKEGLQKLFPNAKFIGEEGSKVTYNDQGEFFIVDPIDGTTNFIKDYHMSCISVAHVMNGEVDFAMIYNPYLDELFWAVKGEGAYCNEKRIHVSEQPLSNGIVLFGSSPYDADLAKKSFEVAYEYFLKALDIRRSGSAALDLCMIAAGRAELFFELMLSPWDYAAGMLIVHEAGGIVTTVEGEQPALDKRSSILARNK